MGTAMNETLNESDDDFRAPHTANGPVKDARHQTFHDEQTKYGDKAMALAEDQVFVSEADSKRICRKTDLNILPWVCWVYFLQILDKSLVGYSAVQGLKTNAHLVGNQYSTLGSVPYFAQLGIQPLAAFMLVKYPTRIILPSIVLAWGASLCGMAGANSFGTLVATRFLLGLFEAASLPLFSLLTTSWYRRSEQPVRVASWYGQNGVASIIGSAVAFGLGKTSGTKLYSYQILFLLFGLITVVTAPLLFWRLDNDITSARFLSPEDRQKGVERLRANQTGIASNEFKWAQVGEMLLEPKTWIWLSLSFCANVGASVSNVFGPVIIQQIVGFSPSESLLLNIPFGAVQVMVILGSSYAAYRWKTKSWVLAGCMIPVVAGCALLYAVDHSPSNQGPLLLGYYLIAFVFTANPLLVSWISGNTAGASKKSSLFCAFNAASSLGNIAGPYIFSSDQAPDYYTGLKAVLAIFCVMIALIALQVVNLKFLNKRKEDQREAAGKTRKLVDTSMDHKFRSAVPASGNEDIGALAFADMTDKDNDEFIFVY